MAPAAIDVRRPGCPRLEPGTVRPSIGNFYNIAGKKDNGTARGKSVASMPKCVRLGSLACHHACRMICPNPRVCFFFLQSWGCAPIGGANTPIGKH